MATASSAFDPLTSVEAGLPSGEKLDAKGPEQGPRTEVGHERTRTMVELGGLAYERGLSQEVLREVRARVAAGLLS